MTGGAQDPDTGENEPLVGNAPLHRNQAQEEREPGGPPRAGDWRQ